MEFIPIVIRVILDLLRRDRDRPPKTRNSRRRRRDGEAIDQPPSRAKRSTPFGPVREPKRQLRRRFLSFEFAPIADPAELYEVRRVPLQIPATSRHLAGKSNILWQSIVRPSAPKPAFVCSWVNWKSIDETSGIPDRFKTDEFRCDASLLTCQLEWSEDARHFARSLVTASIQYVRHVVICSPTDIYDPDALVDCAIVVRDAIVDVDTNSVVLRAADPHFVFGQSDQQIRVGDVPDESLWLVGLDRALEHGSAECPGPVALGTDQCPGLSSPPETGEPDRVDSDGKPFRRKEPGIYRAFRIAVAFLYLTWAAVAAVLAGGGIVAITWIDVGSWQWVVTTTGVLFIVLTSSLLVAFVCAIGWIISANLAGYLRVELPRKLRKKRVPHWTATTSRCIEDGVRTRGAVPLEVWRKLKASDRKARRAARKARRAAAKGEPEADSS